MFNSAEICVPVPEAPCPASDAFALCSNCTTDATTSE